MNEIKYKSATHLGANDLRIVSTAASKVPRLTMAAILHLSASRSVGSATRTGGCVRTDTAREIRTLIRYGDDLRVLGIANSLVERGKHGYHLLLALGSHRAQRESRKRTNVTLFFSFFFFLFFFLIYY